MRKEIIAIVILVIIVIAGTIAGTMVNISQEKKYDEMCDKADEIIADLRNPTEIEALKIEIQGNATNITSLTVGLTNNNLFVLVSVTTADGKVTKFDEGRAIKFIN